MAVYLGFVFWFAVLPAAFWLDELLVLLVLINHLQLVLHVFFFLAWIVVGLCWSFDTEQQGGSQPLRTGIIIVLVL